MLYIIVSAIALVAFIVGNMIPSFAWQALRGITRDGRKKRAEKEEIVKRYPHDSFKLAKAKRKVDKRGVNFSAEGKEAILGYVEKGVPIDIREMLMMGGRGDSPRDRREVVWGTCRYQEPLFVRKGAAF